MRMIAFERGLIGVNDAFKVAYFSGIEEAQKTKDVRVEVLSQGFDQNVNSFGLASFANQAVILTGGFSM